MWLTMFLIGAGKSSSFQYRKRYEITCDLNDAVNTVLSGSSFNTASGMRSHVTNKVCSGKRFRIGFNTASGMRSHVTSRHAYYANLSPEVSIPQAVWDHMWHEDRYRSCHRSCKFQYRKRYEITCDTSFQEEGAINISVSIPQAVWDHMWQES